MFMSIYNIASYGCFYCVLLLFRERGGYEPLLYWDCPCFLVGSGCWLTVAFTGSFYWHLSLLMNVRSGTDKVYTCIVTYILDKEVYKHYGEAYTMLKCSILVTNVGNQYLFIYS